MINLKAIKYKQILSINKPKCRKHIYTKMINIAPTNDKHAELIKTTVTPRPVNITMN